VSLIYTLSTIINIIYLKRKVIKIIVFLLISKGEFIMKKYFMYALILFLPQISTASDLCLDIEVFDVDISAKYLHIKDSPTTSTFAGYVQASDQSFGSAIHANIIDNRVIFSRGAGSGNWSYNLDLSTFDGSSITGTATRTEYNVGRGVSYVSPITNSTRFTVIDCPIEP
jgi:hypothetical protein